MKYEVLYDANLSILLRKIKNVVANKKLIDIKIACSQIETMTSANYFTQTYSHIIKNSEVECSNVYIATFLYE
jgi:hypothetical protein